MNVKMSVFVNLVEAIIYYENKNVRDCRRYDNFQVVKNVFEREYRRHGHFVGFCRRVSTL